MVRHIQHYFKDSPPFGTPDPDILKYLEISVRILVTSNRKSMSAHIEAFQSGAGKLFGLLWVRPGTSVRILAEELFSPRSQAPAWERT